MGEIMTACVKAGGTITGEHGVGLDKLPYMDMIFSADSLATMCALREVFDPERRSNPGQGCSRCTPVANGTWRLGAPRLAREMTAVAVDSVAELRDRVRDAAKRGAPLRIAGRGTWLDAGRPVRATETVSTRELSGITEYVPGDLTLTARAGTTLGEIRDATRKHGQWLALDPSGSDDGTLGATIATASSGPLATRCSARRAISRWAWSSSPALEWSRAAAGES